MRSSLFRHQFERPEKPSERRGRRSDQRSPTWNGSCTLGEQQLVESDSEGSRDFGAHEEEVAGSWLLADSISEFRAASEVLA